MDVCFRLSCKTNLDVWIKRRRSEISHNEDCVERTALAASKANYNRRSIFFFFWLVFAVRTWRYVNTPNVQSCREREKCATVRWRVSITTTMTAAQASRVLLHVRAPVPEHQPTKQKTTCINIIFCRFVQLPRYSCSVRITCWALSLSATALKTYRVFMFFYYRI